MRILLVNPPVYDFACYDYWLKPLGILYIADYLRKNGHEVHLFDFMDRHSPYLDIIHKDRKYSTGKYRREDADTPDVLIGVNRPYYRYGVSSAAFEEYLSQGFDAVLSTSVMTYWYPGVKEVIDSVRKILPNAVMLIGGLYARLLPEHAKALGADDVFTGETEGMRAFLMKNGIDTKTEFDYESFVPAFDLYENNKSAAIMTQTGCPYRCTYCAVPGLYNGVRFFSHDYVIDVLDRLAALGIEDIMLYDDALLYKRKEHFLPLMKRISEQQYKFRLHLSNGLHVRYIDSEVVDAIKSVNIGRIALSAETVSEELLKSTGSKAELEHIDSAIDMFIEAGFERRDIYVYLISGIPGMTIKDIERAADFVHNKGVRVLMNEFSPVPGTVIYEQYKNRIEDPLQTGKSAFTTLFIFTPEEMQGVKSLIKKYNRELG